MSDELPVNPSIVELDAHIDALKDYTSEKVIEAEKKASLALAQEKATKHWYEANTVDVVHGAVSDARPIEREVIEATALQSAKIEEQPSKLRADLDLVYKARPDFSVVAWFQGKNRERRSAFIRNWHNLSPTIRYGSNPCWWTRKIGQYLRRAER